MLHFINGKDFSTKTGNLVNQLAVPIAFTTSFVTVPQVWNIWVLKQTEGVSLLTFGLFFVGNLFWFAYGLQNADKPIMISNFIQGILNILVVIGKITLS